MRMRWIVLLLLPLLLVGCAPAQEDRAPDQAVHQAPRRTFALVVKSLENPYMLTMYDGFRTACEALSVTPVLTGPGISGAPDQPTIVRGLIDQRVDAIAIAANDMEEVSAVLQDAKEAGIPVVSLDSMVKPDERAVHIQQASPETIGRVLIQACAQMMDYAGEFAILTTTESMPNQASWVRWMHQELADHPAQYAEMTLVRTAYGLDEAAKSAEETRRLLEDYPQLKAIIAPTVVGMRAAAAEITRAGSPAKLTGLGLPSEMEPHIASGVCPWMYLWNPSEVGYLAAYAMEALATCAIEGVAGEILTAGALGDRVIAGSADGGYEIVLGNPKVFDAANIAAWSELF